MIVRPSRQDDREYLMSCLEDKIRLFRTAWTHHIAPVINQPQGSVNSNPSIPQVRDLYSKLMGFSHWHEMLGFVREGDTPWEDPRFQFADMTFDLVTHLNDDFMESIQHQRIRLYELLQTPVSPPENFFSAYQGDHGPVETTILLLYRIPSAKLHKDLPSLFTLNKRKAILSSPAEGRQHIVICMPGGGEFTMAEIMETCQVPAAIFANRVHLTPKIAERFQKKEIGLADTRRNLSLSSTWNVNGHLEYLASIMVTPYPNDNIHKTIQQYIYFMVNWMINESADGQIHLDYLSLSEATNLNNYHIDNLKYGRNGFDVNTLCVAVTPSLFLKNDDAERFKVLAKRLVYGPDMLGAEFVEYEQLFRKAVRLSQPARGLMLTSLSEHQSVLMTEHLHNPQSDIIYFDHDNILSAAEWFSRHLHVDGMRHIVDELESVPFGGVVCTYLPDVSELKKEDVESLEYLMESCDKRHLQLVFLSDKQQDIAGITDYCKRIDIINDGEFLKVKTNIG